MRAAHVGGLHQGGSVACFTDKTQKLVTDQVMSIEEVERILDETQEAVDYQRVGVARSWGPPSGSQGVWWPVASPAHEDQAFPHHTGAACFLSSESGLEPGPFPSSMRGHRPQPSHALHLCSSFCSK